MFRNFALLFLISFGFSSALSRELVYNPLGAVEQVVNELLFEIPYGEAGRVVPVRVYLLESKKQVPLVLFSHGLGGSRNNNRYLGEHWAKRGYCAVFMQHPGSDEGVWKDVVPAERMRAMKQAASVENFKRRVQDVSAVIDALTAWNSEERSELFGRLDPEKIGMSGHSFGAKTTQAIAGQFLGGGLDPASDLRVKAAIMMSPSVGKMSAPKAAFGEIRIPCLLMTGTEDISKIGGATLDDRLAVFPNLRNAPAWQVVFDGAEHSAFTEREGFQKTDKERNFQLEILALTTAFWDATLLEDEDAVKWMDGKGAKMILNPSDQWQTNDVRH